MPPLPRQLTLTLATATEPSFSTFVIGDNEEVISHIKKIVNYINVFEDSTNHFRLSLTNSFHSSTCIYFWGTTGSGKTHLLKATTSSLKENTFIFLTPKSPIKSFKYLQSNKLYIIDDCEKLNKKQQIAAFNLFNDISTSQFSFLIVAGNASALHLPLRDDLRSRLSWGLSYLLKPLADKDKIKALLKKADERGLTFNEEVAHYLLSHFTRDMLSLSTLLDKLDHYSMETQRPITIPLVKEMLLQEPFSLIYSPEK